MLADIAAGNTGTADWFFLIAIVLFVVAAIATVRPLPNMVSLATVLGYLGLALISLAWLVL